jgi:hypothetical protein
VTNSQNTGFFSKISNCRELDLVIIDLQDVRPVPHLSFPPESNPEWTKHNVHIVEAIFDFDEGYLYNDDVLLLFVPESTKVKIDVWTYAMSYKLKIAKEW